MTSIRIRKPVSISGQAPQLKQSHDSLEKLADVQHALNSAINTLSREITKLRVKSHMNEIPLSDREMRSLIDAVKALLSSERQQIEAQKINDLTSKLSEQSNAEILEFIKGIVTPAELLNFANSIVNSQPNKTTTASEQI